MYENEFGFRTLKKPFKIIILGVGDCGARGISIRTRWRIYVLKKLAPYYTEWMVSYIRRCNTFPYACTFGIDDTGRHYVVPSRYSPEVMPAVDLLNQLSVVCGIHKINIGTRIKFILNIYYDDELEEHLFNIVQNVLLNPIKTCPPALEVYKKWLAEHIKLKHICVPPDNTFADINRILSVQTIAEMKTILHGDITANKFFAAVEAKDPSAAIVCTFTANKLYGYRVIYCVLPDFTNVRAQNIEKYEI